MPAVQSSSGFISLSDGAELFYEHLSNASQKTLLCIPMAFCSWRLCFTGIDHISKDFNIVSFDPRGFGKSFSKTKRVYSPRDFQQDAKDGAEIMEKLGYDRYSVVGWSSGGTVALILAANHPACVENLIAGAAYAFLTSEDITKMESYEGDDEALAATYLELYGGEEALMNAVGKFYKSCSAISKSPRGDICIDDLKEIKCRTLILHGELDEVIGKHHAEFLRENISDSTLTIFPNGKHDFCQSNPDEVNKEVKDFLS